MPDEIMLLDERISRLESTVAQGFFELTGRADLHDGRIGKVEARMDRLEERMDQLEARMDRLEERMDRLEARMDRLEERMDRLEARMDRLEERMDRLEEQVSLLNRKIDVMAETLEGKIQSVLEHLSASMTEMRRMNVTLRKEHWADRRIIHAILKDHGIRLRDVEGRRGTLPAGRRRRSRARTPRP
jgi:chromosome segregation ATPase